MLELNGRPLVDTAADRRLYVRRDEHGPLVADARQRLNVIVAGDRGIGKTSLLRQVLLDLREVGEPALFVDGKTETDPSSFLELVRRQVASATNLPASTRDAFAESPGESDPSASGSLLDQIDLMRRADVGAQRVLLLVDGLPSPAVGHELFGRMRDELWQLPFAWVIAVDDRERAALMEPPADAFFDRLIDLGPLSDVQSSKVLKRRADRLAANSLRRLAKAGEGNPRVLLALARDTVEDGRGVDDLLRSQEWRETTAAQVSRPASMLLSELESMGAASASDEELLKRLGWTRPRAAQVFAELEAADLVTSREVKGQGRPRKVFQVNRRFRGDG